MIPRLRPEEQVVAQTVEMLAPASLPLIWEVAQAPHRLRKRKMLVKLMEAQSVADKTRVPFQCDR